MSNLSRGKRGVEDIALYLEPKELVEKVLAAKDLQYKQNMEYYRKRDRALLSLLALSGLRISEILSLQTAQFDLESDSEFVIIQDAAILKRRKETIKVDIPLPKEGPLEPLTNIIIDYIECARKGPIFKIGRSRAWQIITQMTGNWCHYYRSQRISFLVNKLRSTDIVSKIMGIKSPQTISHYYKTEWRQHREELK